MTTVFAVLKGAEFYRDFGIVTGNWTINQEHAKTWKTKRWADRQAKASQAIYSATVRVVTIPAKERGTP